MEFERAVYEDIPALMTLRLAYLLEDYGEIPAETCSVIKSNLSGYFQKHLNHDFFAYVCRIHNEIVACCFLYVSEKPANPSFVHGKTGTAMNVYTMPEYRKRGIAETLLRKMLTEARRMGLDYVELKATDSGYALYQKIGFQDAVSKYHPMQYPLPGSSE